MCARKADDYRIGDDATVFMRQLRKPVYYARYRIRNRDLAEGQRYITESLKTDNFDIAVDRARLRIAKLQFQQEAGLALKPVTVAEAIKRFVKQYEDGVNSKDPAYSANSLRQFRNTVTTYWTQYIGHKPISAVTVKDMEGYATWRLTYAQKNNVGKKGNWKQVVAQSTIKSDINYFRTVLRWCAQHGLYSGKVYEWNKYKGGDKQRRSGLTIEQYKQLSKYLHSPNYIKSIAIDNIPQFERHRWLLRCYILFLLASGLRLGEARELRWKDIELRKNSAGKLVPIIYVAAEKSKWGKSRYVVARQRAMAVAAVWMRYRKHIGETVTPDTYIFSDKDNNTYDNLLVGVKTVLREAGVDKDADGNEYVIYSFRHSYIQWQISYNKNFNIYKLAQNCGTSVQMIQQFYSDARTQDFIDDFS